MPFNKGNVARAVKRTSGHMGHSLDWNHAIPSVPSHNLRIAALREIEPFSSNHRPLMPPPPVRSTISRALRTPLTVL